MSSNFLRDFYVKYQNTPGSDALLFVAAKCSHLPRIPAEVVGSENLFDYLTKWSERGADSQENKNYQADEIDDVPDSISPVSNAQIVENELPAEKCSAVVDENKDPSSSKDVSPKNVNSNVNGSISKRLRRNLNSLNIKD